MEKIKDRVHLTLDFVKSDVWRIRANTLPPFKAILVKTLRIILLTIREYNETQCPLRASALTFYTVLSIVPLAAMAFGIAKGFGVEKMLEQQLLKNLQGQEDVIIKVIDFANTMLETTKGGVIAGIGIAVLFWTVIKVLGHIESSLNAIWNIKKPRPLGRKLSDYIFFMVIAPTLVVLSGSVNVFIQTQVIMITQKISLVGMFSPMIFFGLKFLPYTLIWILFTMIYLHMPNGKVQIVSAVLAGVAAGTIYQVTQWFYIHFQVGVSSYGAIYGSFAALPLFLVWLQVSWLIVLFGASISAAHQNIDNYEFEPDSKQISPYFIRLLTLQVSHLLVENFAKGKQALSAVQISETLEIPLCLCDQILDKLIESKIISYVKTDENEAVYFQPARDINHLTIKYIMDALEQNGVNEIPVAQNKAFESLSKAFETFNEAVEKSPANKLLKDL